MVCTLPTLLVGAVNLKSHGPAPLLQAPVSNFLSALVEAFLDHVALTYRIYLVAQSWEALVSF